MDLNNTLLAHFRALRKMAGITLTITRVDQSCSGVEAVLAKAGQVAITTREAVQVAGAQDVLILAREYKPTGSVTEPEAGDILVYVAPNGDRVTLEVQKNERDLCFTRWHGDAVLRVFGKATAREVA